MILKQYYLGCLAHASYLLGDDAGSTAQYIGMQRSGGKSVYTIGAPAPYASKQFGFAVYTKSATGWTISLRDADGVERRACSVVKGTVSCPS